MLRIFPVYLAFFAALFFDAASGRRVFLEADIHPYYYPIWNFAVERVREGSLPFWNPLVSFGAPFAANLQSCLFYPLSILWYLGDFAWGLNAYVLVHLAMAAFFTHVFMRASGASHAGAWLAGFAFSLSGYMMSAVRLTISLASVAYFPLVLLLSARAGSERGFFWKAMTALALVLQYLAGDPAVCYVTLAVCFLQSARSLTRLKALGLSVFLFLMLAAFQWLPFAEFIAHSSRAAPTLEAAVKWSFPFSDLPGVVWPGALLSGSELTSLRPGVQWLESAYAGLVVCVLAAASLSLKPGQAQKKLWGIALFGLLLSLGGHTPFYALFYATAPFFKMLRFPERFFFLVHFSLACLAGFGLDRLRAGGRRWLVPLAITAVVADLALLQAARVPMAPRESLESVPPSVRTVRAADTLGRVMTSPSAVKHIYTREDFSLGRTFYDAREAFFPNLPMLDGLHTPLNYDSLFIAETDGLVRFLMRAPLSEAKPALDRLGIEYLVSTKDSLEGFEIVHKTSHGHLFRNPGAWSRAFWVSELPLREDARPLPASITEYGPNRVRMSVSAPADGHLVFMDAFYPAWKARLDGQEVQVARVEKAFRALEVPRGSHRIEWFYDPLTFKIGGVISLAGLCLLAIGLRRRY